MAHIKRAVKWVCFRHVVVGVPQFDRRVEISHATHAAPFKNCWAVDIPREVEQNIAGSQTLCQKAVKVFASYLTNFVFDSLLDCVGNTMSVIDKIDDRY